MSESLLASLRREASRPGRAIDGGAAFTPVRDNVLLDLLEAVDALDGLTRLEHGLLRFKVVNDGKRVEMLADGDASERCVHALERLGVNRVVVDSPVA